MSKQRYSDRELLAMEEHARKQFIKSLDSEIQAFMARLRVAAKKVGMTPSDEELDGNRYLQGLKRARAVLQGVE